ncbi:succinate semialdehyde dehydrogenase [Paraburkholderia eburnea]|uniref:Succinate semialdehyde dehydrogenase n=1 Tax=Paraburkholderia eburnea TaxID=1189126 RepID=A0A2S4MCB1_9BURK|nr:NAD-dependent succinate-semialdehyde dehydrogenase [Paraburkholderia eburnea]POR52275.1 succinate semialdehyde dehydrogenase [Paraburkholderia eburnea]PRZ23166.1 succinate semialdehyde dehydrogenase [Paraburkholderia eburnea]
MIDGLKEARLLRTSSFIDGEWVASDTTFTVIDPARGTALAQVARAGARETLQAVAAASQAFPAWRDATAAERGAKVRRWGELMLAHREDLARIMVAEQGKPYAEALGEVAYAASFLTWFAEEARRAYGDVIPAPKKGARIVVTKEAVGVVGAITPWNFPLAMVTRKAGPALAAGCTMVLKPSEETPLSAFALAVLAEEAGIPRGVFNVVTGDAPAIGDTLMASKAVRKISFTGSTRVGKLLMRAAADSVKKVSLELGGNAPFIVFDDADLDAAVEGAMASKFRNTGQTCVCVNRFYVQAGVHDAFVEKLTAAVRALRVANGMEAGATQGPLINAAALRKVQAHVSDAREKGGEIVCGGKAHALGGTFYEPTIITGAHGGMMLAHEETFGPVAAIFRFDTEEEAIQAANDTDFGLSAYFYSRDIGRVWRVAGALESGMVGVNEGIISTEVAPFGGVKESGLGREGSKYGLDEYLETKYMMMGGLG